MLFDKMYVCHFDKLDDKWKVIKRVYKEPIEYKCAISPLTGDTEVAIYGERVNKMFSASLNTYNASMFRENDLVYYGIVPPTEMVKIDDLGNVLEEDSEVDDEDETTLESTKISRYQLPYGKGANYKVVSVRPYNLKTIVYFELLP